MKTLNRFLLALLFLGVSACADKNEEDYSKQWASASTIAMNDVELAKVLYCKSADQILDGYYTYYQIYVPKNELINKLNKGDVQTSGDLFENARVEIGESKIGKDGGGYFPGSAFHVNLKIHSQFTQTTVFEITDAVNELDTSNTQRDLGKIMLMDKDSDVTIGKSDGAFFPSEMECKSTGWQNLNIINYKK